MDVRSSLPYELRVGVSGHRTLPDEPAVARAIRRLLDRIGATLQQPESAPPEWTVISPLARGADRLVAEAVLERTTARLDVVTPFPLEEYRKDFHTQEDRTQFEALLARASHVQEMDGLEWNDEPDSDEARQTARDVGYFRVGERVVEACEMLIVIWNGRAAGLGGTAEIVRYALQRERAVLWIHADRPDDPPRMIRAVKYAAGDIADVDAVPLPDKAKALSRGFHQQAAYFRDEATPTAHYTRVVQEAHDKLVGVATASGLPPAAIEPLLRLFVPQFVRADELAIFYQRRHTRLITGILYLAASGVTVAVAQVLFWPAQSWVIAFEVAAMVAVLALWWYGRREAWHEKWLHDRYLAERLRMAIFTTLVGGPPSEGAGDNPLPFYRNPQQWLTRAVSALARTASGGLQPLPFEPLKRFVAQAWLEDQRGFHARTASAKARIAHRRHYLGFALFGTTLVAATFHLFRVGHALGAGLAPILRPDAWFTLLALVLPVWAAAVHAGTTQLEFERIEERSTRMATVLGMLAGRAQRARRLEELREVADEAVRLMTMENTEWWVLLSFQDVRLHV